MTDRQLCPVATGNEFTDNNRPELSVSFIITETQTTKAMNEDCQGALEGQENKSYKNEKVTITDTIPGHIEKE